MRFPPDIPQSPDYYGTENEFTLHEKRSFMKKWIVWLKKQSLDFSADRPLF